MTEFKLIFPKSQTHQILRNSYKETHSEVWFGLFLFKGSFSTNRLYRAMEIQCISRRAGNNTTIQLNSETIE